MEELARNSLGFMIGRSIGKISEKNFVFLVYVLGRFNNKGISADDFAEQVKRSACDLCYGKNKNGEKINHLLARDQMFVNIGDFISEMREVTLIVFHEHENFAKRVSELLPERVRNQLS